MKFFTKQLKDKSAQTAAGIGRQKDAPSSDFGFMCKRREVSCRL